MAREITNFSPGYVTVHTVVGESGKGITALNKQTGSTIGDAGRAYAATLFEAGAFTRIAKAAGKTYGVGVVVMTHGETDAEGGALGPVARFRYLHRDDNQTGQPELLRLVRDARAMKAPPSPATMPAARGPAMTT